MATRVSSGRGRGRCPLPGHPQPFLHPYFSAFGGEKTLRMPMVTRRLRDPDVNPCLLESDASTRCMAENNYDKESCSSHFLKYKNCRKFWNSVMIQRRQNGVKPPMPTAAERDEILGALGKMPY
uniref:Coiled-coil-helix-coiled-coil-helix domain containing 7 n=2 Tax=Ovis aries TaxID=9940 RepID=A0AC11E2W5_SHEEP